MLYEVCLMESLFAQPPKPRSTILISRTVLAFAIFCECETELRDEQILLHLMFMKHCYSTSVTADFTKCHRWAGLSVVRLPMIDNSTSRHLDNDHDMLHRTA